MSLLLSAFPLCSLLEQIADERGGTGVVCNLQYANTPWGAVLVRLAGAVKRHHGHRHSYKEKDLTGADLQFQKFSLLSS